MEEGLTPRCARCTLYTMKRTNHYIPQQQMNALKRVSKEEGLSVSELIRTAIAAWLALRGAGPVVEKPVKTGPT